MKRYLNLIGLLVVVLFLNFSPILLNDSSGELVIPKEDPFQESIRNPKNKIHQRLSLLSRGGEERILRFEISDEFAKEEPIEIVTSSTSYTEEDLYWLSRVIHAEAPGDTTEGQIAVGNVVLNRLNAGWSNSIKNVIFQNINDTYQFTPVEDGKIYNNPSQRAVDNAIRVLSGERVIPNNIYYFYMPAPYNQNNWIRTRTVYKKIGVHLFCY
jgi:spore germination cell wall hydrolase CwlJ-like protein